MARLLAETNLVVETILWCDYKRRTLKHSSEFSEATVDLVEAGLCDEDWEGLLYVMHWGNLEHLVPLYIGKTERRGKKNKISANIRNIRGNLSAFARWGYSLDYHIGDLSHALFGWEARRPPRDAYGTWVDRLFQRREPPTLRQPVHVTWLNWYRGMNGPYGQPCSITQAEKELIRLARLEHPGTILNVRDC
ncbi:MAG: hypothetical protein FJW34_09220 [Acidobacteria bacterium]|nr:hypothetical protein [Acidobacteriota bacterium]